MQETKLVQIGSETGSKVIITPLTDAIASLLESEGIMWFEALQHKIILSNSKFRELDLLITPDPG